VKKSPFLDRFFVAVVIVAFLVLFGGLAFSFIDAEPRASKASLLLQNFRP
jgi:hypothetical protein